MKVGDKFKNVSTGEIFTVTVINEKFKQVAVEGKDGKAKPYSSSTLKDKRRFIPIEDDEQYVQEVMQQKKDLGIECPKIDSYEVVEDDRVSAEDLEKALMTLAKKSGRKKASGELTGVGKDIKDYTVAAAKKLGAEVCESNGRFISFKVNNKMFAAIFSYSKKSLTLGVRSKSIEGKTNPDSTVNHMMDARFKFDSLTDNVKELIRLILESAFEYQSNLKK